MATQKSEGSRVSTEPAAEAPRQAEGPERPEYGRPELCALGTLATVQGRNYYSDRDAGNSNYYI